MNLSNEVFKNLLVLNNYKESIRIHPVKKQKVIKQIKIDEPNDMDQKQAHPISEINFATQFLEKLKLCDYNVVGIGETKQTKDYFYIVMERCDSSILQEIRTNNTFRENQMQIMHCLIQIFKGYKFLQSLNKDFIHRDLTLDNLLIKKVYGKIVVKIAHFGILKYDTTIINSQINGKTDLAPEFVNSKTYTNLVDMYSLGICLYYMMYGLQVKPQFEDNVLALEDNNNRFVKLIKEMTNQLPENRMNWDDLKSRLAQDHVIFYSEHYKEPYNKTTFLESAYLIIKSYEDYFDLRNNHREYFQMVDHREQFQKFDFRKYFQTFDYREYFQMVDYFISMIKETEDEYQIYILIQVFFTNNEQNMQDLYKEVDGGNFLNLEFLQTKYYFRVILQSTIQHLRGQQTIKTWVEQQNASQVQYRMVRQLMLNRTNNQYYNLFLNQEQYRDILMSNVIDWDKEFKEMPPKDIQTLKIPSKDQRKVVKQIKIDRPNEKLNKQDHPNREFIFAIKIMEAQEFLQSHQTENVVKIFETNQTKEYFYIVMERCDNSILKEIKTNNIFRENQMQIMHCLIQIFKGYKFLQSLNKDFIHRDLTLDNLLIKKVDGKIIVKIADFGICKNDTTIKIFQINGKTDLAPEFYKTKTYTNLVDMYSLGICLYYMMYGDKVKPQFKDNVLALEDNNNRFVKLIKEMTNQLPENRMNWDDLKSRLAQDHVIFYSEHYKEPYNKSTFLESAYLIIKFYEDYLDLRNNHKEYFQMIDYFISMIKETEDVYQIYILIQVFLTNNEQNMQDLYKEVDGGNFLNLEFLQTKYYFRVILQSTIQHLRGQQTIKTWVEQYNASQAQYRVVRQLMLNGTNNQYYNLFLNQEQYRDVGERACCSLM